jgi:hypothetical protein
MTRIYCFSPELTGGICRCGKNTISLVEPNAVDRQCRKNRNNGDQYQGAAQAVRHRLNILPDSRPSHNTSSCRASTGANIGARGGDTPPATRAAVVAAMAGHVRGKGVYTGLFKRTQ